MTMATQGSNSPFNAEAAVAITAGQLVKFTAAALVTTSTVAGEACAGYAQTDADAGDMVAVVPLGLSSFIAGGALTAGTHTNLMSAGNGKSIAYVTAAANFITGTFIPSKKDPGLVDGDIGLCAAVPSIAGL